MPELLTYRHDPSLVTLSLDDGKVNVMSSRMIRAVNEALDQAQLHGPRARHGGPF